MPKPAPSLSGRMAVTSRLGGPGRGGTGVAFDKISSAASSPANCRQPRRLDYDRGNCVPSKMLAERSMRLRSAIGKQGRCRDMSSCAQLCRGQCYLRTPLVSRSGEADGHANMRLVESSQARPSSPAGACPSVERANYARCESLAFAVSLLASDLRAQTDTLVPPSAYAARRTKLRARCKRIIVPGRHLVGQHELPRQDADFWYLTGVESPYAVLVMSGGRTALFPPDTFEFAGAQFPHGGFGLSTRGVESAAKSSRARRRRRATDRHCGDVSVARLRHACSRDCRIGIDDSSANGRRFTLRTSRHRQAGDGRAADVARDRRPVSRSNHRRCHAAHSQTSAREGRVRDRGTARSGRHQREVYGHPDASPQAGHERSGSSRHSRGGVEATRRIARRVCAHHQQRSQGHDVLLARR